MLSLLTQWLSSPEAHRLALTLLHTLWQAAAIALLLRWAVLSWLPARACEARHAATLGAMVLVLVAGLGTWSLLGWSPGRGDAPAATAVEVSSQASAGATSGLADVTAREVSDTATMATGSAPVAAADAARRGTSLWTWWLVAGWAAGVTVMLLRAVAALLHVHVRLLGSAGQAPGHLVRVVEEITGEMRLTRRVRVLVRKHLPSPAVVGAIWPTLLMPAAAMTGLSHDQLRVVIAHELAHVRRHDYLVNLLQLLFEAVLFFNPAAWWLSRQLRIEREACCDALATRVVGAEHRPTLAQVLVDLAEQQQAASMPLAATPLGGGRGGGRDGHPLVDRVRRLLLPHERPRTRLPWYTLLGMLALVIVAMGGLHAATNIAVTSIAAALTPQERIERLHEVRQTHGAPLEELDATAPENRVTVRGRVRTADGMPLPEGTRIHYRVRTSNSGLHSIAGGTVDDGPFTGRLPYGRIHIGIQGAAGYAPVVKELDVPEPGATVEDIELVMSAGFSARLRLLDGQGQPLPHAELTCAYLPDADGWRIGHHTVTSDAQGIVELAHVPAYPMHVTAEVPGHQHDIETFELEPDRTVTWQLRSARPTRGVVVDRDTAEPVADAELHLVRRQGFAATSHDPRYRHHRILMATADDAGRFTLDTLNHAARYTLMAMSNTHGPELVHDVEAGQDLRIELGPHRSVRGRIVGDLTPLIDDAGRHGPELRWNNNLRVDSSAWSHQQRTPLRIDDGEAHFELRQLVPGDLTLHLAGTQHGIDIGDEPIDDLVIDLDALLAPDADPGATRRVVLRLEHPEDWPTPHGRINIHAVATDGRRFDETFELEEGWISFDAPAPGEFRYEAQGLVGYWIARGWHRNVAPGDEPLVVDVPTVPAGSIYGRVLDARGRPAANVQVRLHPIESPTGVQSVHMHDANIEMSAREPGRFHITAVPLGGVYRVIASVTRIDNAMLAVSDPLRLDDEQPMHEIELRFIEGRDLAVRVLDADGNPLAGVPVALSKRSDIGVGSLHAGQHTDRDGRHTWHNANVELPIAYHAVVGPTDTLHGRRVQLDPDAPLTTIQLQRGIRLAGVVINDETGEPWPRARVRLYPANPRADGFNRTIELRTDDRGRFTAHNLEAVTYRLHIDAAHPAGAEITTTPDGRRAVRHPPGVAWPQVNPADGEPVEVRAVPRE